MGFQDETGFLTASGRKRKFLSLLMGENMKAKRIIFGGSVFIALMLLFSGQSKGWMELKFAPRLGAQAMAEPSFPKSPLAALNKPGRNPAGEAAGQAENAMIQYRAGGHVLGFTAEGVLIATGTHALKLEFSKANKVPPVCAGGVGRGDSENESAVAAKEAPPLTEVRYPGLWPGVTLKYEGKNGSVAKSTYEVSAGADPSSISLKSNVPVEIDRNGLLHYRFETGELIESKPVAWQEIDGRKVDVGVSFRKTGEQEIGFLADGYDRDHSLIIDPVLIWNTFLGSAASSVDSGTSITVDGFGNMYISGYSDGSWGNPIHPWSGGMDAFAAKLNASGELQWNTFLGGGGYGAGEGIAVDGAGNVYVAGIFVDPSEPRLILSSPDGGESWISGSTHNITWTAMGIIANVKLEYSADNGANWTTIIASTTNDGSHPWSLPVVASSNCHEQHCGNGLGAGRH